MDDVKRHTPERPKKRKENPNMAANKPVLTVAKVLRDVTTNFIAGINTANPPDPETLEGLLLQETVEAIDGLNAMRPKEQKVHLPNHLSPGQIAELMLATQRIVNVSCMQKSAEKDYDLLAIYEKEGPDEGIYSTSDDEFCKVAWKFDFTLQTKELSEIMNVLKKKAPRVSLCQNPDMIAVNNGIFDYRTKTLMPFSPDKVFLSKSRVDYVANPVNPVIHNPDDGTDWDVESWMASLSDDGEVVQLLWQISGAVIRPNVRWNKSAWLYSSVGRNGKGTLCAMLRNLCGEGNYAALKLSEFSVDFALEPLIHSSAIITDENDVGTFIDKAANLKAIITNDVIQINRKFKTPIAYQFRGFMVQCMNEMPKVKDKSDSFYRRQLFIPFLKTFDETQERKYIKDDYLARKEVLQYVLWRVLHMDYYKLDEPAACTDVLNEYKEFNDPVRQFWCEMEDQFAWDLLPFNFLYELYKKWFQANSPGGGIMGKNTFLQNLQQVLRENGEWTFPAKAAGGKYVPVRSAGRMEKPEPLILKYGLDKWKREGSTPSMNPNRIASPDLQTFYRGIVRTGSMDMGQTKPDSQSGDESRSDSVTEPGD